MNKQTLSLLISLACCSLIVSMASALGNVFYVDQRSTVASDSNDGSESAPFLTLSRASEMAKAGDTVRVKPGIYREILVPKHSGTESAPVVFEADGENVWIKGSDEISGWDQEGALWVKRPWTKRFYYEDKWDRMSSSETGYSARREQVFVNGKPLQWASSRENIPINGFWWAPDGSELYLHLPEEVDPNQELVEVPLRDAVVAAWPGVDIPRTSNEADRIRKESPDRLKYKKLPEINWIVVRGFNFAHNAALFNRSGVRIQGKHWLIEDNVIEWMNTVGVNVDDGTVLRGNVTKYNGQNGIGHIGIGSDVVIEDNVSLWDNEREFSSSWGGAAIKLCLTENVLIQNQVILGAEGPGMWFDQDCRNVTIRDCVVLPNREGPKKGSYGGIFYEISYDAQIYDNVILGNHNKGTFSVYGGGITISSSTVVSVDNNAVLFSDGGIGIPGGPRNGGGTNRYFEELGVDSYWSKDIDIGGNLIVGDLRSSLYAREESVFNPDLHNWFSGNTVVASNSGGTIRLGGHVYRSFEGATTAYPDFIGDNLIYSSLPDAGTEMQGRMNWVSERLLQALERIGVSTECSGSVDQTLLWKFSDTDVQGVFVRCTTGNVLILDAPNEEHIRILNPANTQTRKWDSFSDSWTDLKSENSVLYMQVNKGLTVVTGLCDQSIPFSFLTVWAEVDGEKVSKLYVAQSFDLMVHVENGLSGLHDFVVAGGPFDSQTITLDSGAIQSIRRSLIADGSRYNARVELLTKGFPTQAVELAIPVVSPVLVHRTSGEKSAPELFEMFDGNAMSLGSENQRVADIYDLKTGIGWDGKADCSGNVDVLWSKDKFCAMIDVIDDVVAPVDEGKSWNGDNVELFIDARESGLGDRDYNQDVYHFHAKAPTSEAIESIALTGRVPDGATAVGRKTSQGYQVLLVVPAEGLKKKNLSAGVRLGFDVAIDDSDDPKGLAGRKTQLVLWGDGRNYADASGFGSLVLSDE